MSASESSPLSANLQESIGQLIADAVRQSQADNLGDNQELKAAMAIALEEIAASKAALNRAEEVLRNALGTGEPEVTAEAEPAPVDEVVEEVPAPSEAATEQSTAVVSESAEANPHELDIIAHRVDIDTAMNLQSMLRGRPEVTSAQTREFANGELRLHLSMGSRMDMAAFTEWVEGRKGTFGTQTDSVIELDFGR